MKAAAPILLTAGQQDLEYLVTEPVLSADLATLARPFVKWAAEVHRVADLPRLVHRAAKTALAPPTGPVFLSLPGDMLKAEADLDLMAPTRVAPRLRGDAAAVAASAALLAQAKRPVIFAGDAVAQSRAHAELVALAELIGAPVYAEFVPNTASFPASHPLARGAMVRTQAGVRQVLDQHGVCVRASHHCAKPLMRRLAVAATARASLYVYNDEADVDALATGLDSAADLFLTP